MTAAGRWVFGLLLAFSSVSAIAAPDDPLEPFNRKVQGFNDFLDGYLLRPVAVAYDFVTPQPIERGIHNVFLNLDGPLVAINQLLQGKPLLAFKDTSRFLLNSTVGLAGLFDVATKVGLDRHDEDFGQTFTVWGIPSGPYLVLPFFGPSTAAGTFGIAADTFAEPLTYVNPAATRYGAKAFGYVDLRTQLLDADKLITGDRYLFFRDAYLQRRNFLVHDGQVRDTFLDEEN